MQWTKLGRLYEPRPLHDRLRTHAAYPVPIALHGDVFRVFFGGRDAENRTSIGYVDVDIRRSGIVATCEAPVFSFDGGQPYFARGLSPACCYRDGDTRYFLFMGWEGLDGGQWQGQIGRLRLGEDLSLELASPAPFLPLNADDPISISYPAVCPRPGGGFDMWYASTVTRDAANGEMLHPIMHATSRDGTVWQRHGVAVPFSLGDAQVFARPTVIEIHGGLNMWFSYRGAKGTTYRIGHARFDGVRWVRNFGTVAGIDVSDDGWDSEMVCYPSVFHHDGAIYMLFNGNGYGRTGFGLAVLETI